MGNKQRNSLSIGDALFGATRQAVLRLLFQDTNVRLYQHQIIRTVNLGSGTVQRELNRLADAGIITRSVEGRQVYFGVNTECPIHEELRGIVRKSFGVVDVLKRALSPLSHRLEMAFLYGSLAAGTEITGSDIDLMVIGEVSLREIVDSMSDTQRSLGREVNPSVYPTAEFRRKIGSGNHFLANVLEKPKVFLIGDEQQLAGLAQVRVAQRASDESPGDRGSSRSRTARHHRQQD